MSIQDLPPHVQQFMAELWASAVKTTLECVIDAVKDLEGSCENGAMTETISRADLLEHLNVMLNDEHLVEVLLQPKEEPS